MAAKKDNATISAPLGIHELELALIREKAAWKEWELAAATREIQLMKRICKKTQWPDEYQPLLERLDEELKLAARVLRNQDTTRITAMHSSLEGAIFGLRDLLYR